MVDCPVIQQTTTRGDAYFAGVYPAPSTFADKWRLEHRFAMSAATRERKLKG